MYSLPILLALLVGCGSAPSELKTNSLENLKLNVTFNYSKSKEFKSPKDFVPLIAGMQRILDQAYIEVSPKFAAKYKSTNYLDMVFRPRKEFEKDEDSRAKQFVVRSLFEVDINEKPYHKKLAAIKDVPIPEYLKSYTKKKKINLSKTEAALARTMAFNAGVMLWLPEVINDSHLMNRAGTGTGLAVHEIRKMRIWITRYSD